MEHNIVKALAVLDPCNLQGPAGGDLHSGVDYGQDEMSTLSEHFDLPAEALAREWVLVCNMMKQPACRTMTLQDFYVKHLHREDCFPNIGSFTDVSKCYNYMCGARRRAGSARTLLLFLVTCMHDAMQAMCMLCVIWRTADTVTCGTKD